MSAGSGLRIGVFGATGVVGGELLRVLERRRFPASELVAFAGADSELDEVEFRGDSLPVHGTPETLAGIDLAFLCAPRDVALELARRALRGQVPCLDLSGALAASPEVPLWWPGAEADEALRAPLVSVLGGPSLAWALVLRPLDRAARVRAVVGTGCESASGGGRRGLEALSEETIALLNQQEAPERGAFEWPVAFDCHAGSGETDERGRTPGEGTVARDLARAVGEHVAVDATLLRLPTFSGEGAALAVDTERPLALDEAGHLLAKAPFVEVAEPDLARLRTRAASGRESVVVGRVRASESGTSRTLLWLAMDTPRLVAASAVELAEARVSAG